MRFKTFAFFLIFLFVLSFGGNAQTEVTFQVNLEPQLKDSIYVPGRDQVYLKGNLYPLSNTNKVYLTDEAPIDSVFETTVDFPSTASGKILKYNFFIQTPSKLRKEQMPRSLKLRHDKIKVDPLYFNTFAW